MSGSKTTKSKYYDGLHSNAIYKIVSIAYLAGQRGAETTYQEVIDVVRDHLEKYRRAS